MVNYLVYSKHFGKRLAIKNHRFFQLSDCEFIKLIATRTMIYYMYIYVTYIEKVVLFFSKILLGE